MSNLTQAKLTPEQRALLRSMGKCSKPELLKRLLRHFGLSQSGLSRKHNLPYSSINFCFKGLRPNAAVRSMAVKELGLPEEVLFDPWPAKRFCSEKAA
jgi:hypothetical protein